MVKVFSSMYRWTRFVNAHQTHLLESSNTHKQTFSALCCFPRYPDKVEPHCQATAVEFGSPHEAICAGFFDICLPLPHFYLLPSLIPDVYHAWGGCGWYKHIPKHFNTTVNVMRP
jgi:hypothetical protein